MIKKSLIVLANNSTDAAKLPNKGVYASRFNIRADIDSVAAYKGKPIICTQSPKLGNITSNLNFYGREPGKCVITVRLKSNNSIIAQYTINCIAWVAHRGYMGQLRPLKDRPVKKFTADGVTYSQITMTTGWTENTATSFEKAVQAGAYGLETDPKLTKDGKLIVLHDPVFGGTYAKGKPYEHKYHDALTNGPTDVPIHDRTLAQIQKMRVRRVGAKQSGPAVNRIMLFSDFLNLCEKYRIHPVIDLSGYSNEPARQQLVSDTIAKEIKKRPKSKKLVLALPGTYKVLAKSLGVNASILLFKYDIDEKNQNDVNGKFRALLNEVPCPSKLANWKQIKDYEWFK